MLRRVGIGATKNEHVVSDETLGGPNLLAVDNPLVAVKHSLCAEVGEIGTGIGLTEALTPSDGARKNLGKEFLLLLFGTPLENGWADKRVAEEVGAHRCAGICEFFCHHNGLHGGETLAAVLGGPRGADPTAAIELGRPFLEEQRALIGTHFESGFEPTLRQVLFKPPANFAAVGLGVFRIVQVHGRQSSDEGLCRPIVLPKGSEPLPAG